jgi:AcrR family transcriptional regulator
MVERKRLSPEAARQKILMRAEHYLIIGGPDAVRVQVVADDLGITDAAIHYHFKNRKGLMTALLKEAGRKLKAEIAEISKDVAPGTNALDQLADRLTDLYQRKKYARLATWLASEGWQSEGGGLFDPLVEQLCASTADTKTKRDVQYSLALLNTFLIGDDLVGGAFLASVSLPGDGAGREIFRDWVVEQISAGLTSK